MSKCIPEDLGQKNKEMVIEPKYVSPNHRLLEGLLKIYLQLKCDKSKVVYQS